MKVKPNTLSDIAARQRDKLHALLDERAVAKYSFSYRRLAKLLDALNCEDIPDALAACVLGFSEEDTRAAVEELNDKIQAIYATNNLQKSESGSITLLVADPFGRLKDYIYMTSQSVAFSSTRAIEGLVRKYKLNAVDVKAIFDAATTKKPYATLQARDHKEGKEL